MAVCVCGAELEGTRKTGLACCAFSPGPEAAQEDRTGHTGPMDEGWLWGGRAFPHVLPSVWTVDGFHESYC